VKKVALLKAKGLEIETFVLSEFIDDAKKKLSKKKIRVIADTLKLEYQSKEIEFSKKILNAYIQNGK